AALAETINVTGSTPLIETATSSVGGVVDVKRIESMPLNGRQFANLAATIPGVGLGFHTDPTKSTQYSPQINGGNGRNVNYQIDKQDYRRNQFGGSFGGPVATDKAHFFAAVERTQQNTFQSVTTKGLFPNSDGIFPLPYRENLVTAKETTNLNAAQYLSVRY